MSKADVAINIFAKPFQTALALLSLIRHCKEHLGTIWLQFEKVASRHDNISVYHIADYLQNELSIQCVLTQPDIWLHLEPPDESKLYDFACRKNIRYQTAFEKSKADSLFVMHNDIFIVKDIIGALNNSLGDALAVGQIGQCWNCPAANRELALEVTGLEPCSPQSYTEWRPDFFQLKKLYAKAREKNIFVRPYEDGFDELYQDQSWPLPECRVNEWACLINLKKIREFCYPHGDIFPFGAFKRCGSYTLDTATFWFRELHKKGLTAKHFDLGGYLHHWVGTGNNTEEKYLASENKAAKLLKSHFPEYLAWLNKILIKKNIQK